MKKLRIVYMGTPEFAVAPLKLLLENKYNIVGVVTNPDKPAGRGQKIQESAVKVFAKEKGLNILQPTDFRAESFLKALSMLQADLQIVVAFKFLPKVVWGMPPLGTVNLHASLLPEYRGAAPINWAIINGEVRTGVTTFFLQNKIDTGHIIDQVEVPILEDETAGTLHDKLMQIGADLLLKTTEDISNDNYNLTPQAKDEVEKVAPKIFRTQCRIDWNKELKIVYKHICGLSPYPAAWTNFIDNEGKKTNIKIYKSRFSEGLHAHSPGTIFTNQKDKLSIAVHGGYINILELQQAGRKRMKIKDFLRGFSMDEITLF